MANVPQDLRYTKDHEWVRELGNGRVRVGITDYAQRQLGDVVHVELWKVGDRLEAEEPFGSVESVKSVSELFAPLGGKIAAVNELLEGEPEQVNDDPYGEGWMIEIEVGKSADLTSLLSASGYEEFISPGTE
ncbi:glycine cleavage system H protein [Streptomyces sp. TLI_235]|nr:glycine cleavage system protein GcvH [Streptomyces sp. TLI_235]PBC70557.1 glycine cleavage system H protein [Streptomyces sp. TLI_235]